MCDRKQAGTIKSMNTPQTTAQRVAKLRAARDALGLKRLDVYAHPDDHTAIKTLADKLQRKRTKGLSQPKKMLTLPETP